MEPLLVEDFQPELNLSQAQFDDDNLVIKDVSLTYHKSRHGRIYGETAMSDLRVLSEGAIVYDDAHIKSATQEHANLSEMGEIKNVRGDGVRNRGDLHLFPEYPKSKLFFKRVKAAPESYALSHEATKNVVAATRRGPLRVEGVGGLKGYVITKIPATNTTLTESLEDTDMDLSKMDLSKLTLEDLKKENKEVYDALCEAMAEQLDSDNVKAGDPKTLLRLEIENEKLKGELADLKKVFKEKEDEAKRQDELAEVSSKAKTMAEEANKKLTESMLNYLVQDKTDLSVLTEDFLKDFISELPDLITEGADDGEPKPRSKSSSGGGGGKRPMAASNILKMVRRQIR